MTRPPRPLWLLLSICFVFVAFAALGAELQPSWGESRSKLIALAKQKPFAAGTYVELVASLTSEARSPENVAWVYYTAAYELWCRSNVDPELQIRYAAKAVELPLPDPEAVQAHIIIGGSISVMHRGAMGRDLLVPRKQAAEAYLRAIRRGMQGGLPVSRPADHVPKDDWDLPGFEDFTPEVEAEAERKARESRRAYTDDFLRNRELGRQWDEVHVRTRSAEAAIVRLYSMFPFRTDELQDVGSRILNDDRAVADLVGRVEANTRRRTNAAAEAITTETIRSDLVVPEASERPATNIAPVPGNQLWVLVPSVGVFALVLMAIWLGYRRKR